MLCCPKSSFFGAAAPIPQKGNAESAAIRHKMKKKKSTKRQIKGMSVRQSKEMKRQRRPGARHKTKEKSKQLTGMYRSNARGFGFVVPSEEFRDEFHEDIFIPKYAGNGAMDRDTVLVSLREARGGNKETERSGRLAVEGEVERILERSAESVIGTLHSEKLLRPKRGVRYYVTPDGVNTEMIVRVGEEDLLGAAVGDKVEVQLTRYPSGRHRDACGIISRVFGASDSRLANYQAILYENHIRTEFDDTTLKEAERVASHPITAAGRLDLREKLIFTIDGADAKDLDDAISLEALSDGYLLGVHIADVSSYVEMDSAVDREAYLRGTSVYFTDQVVPMLPKVISNGCCSLTGGEERYALSALIRLDKNGEIMTCELKESIICSKIRGVYAELNDILERGEASAFYGKYSVLFPEVYPRMVELYRILEKKGVKKGALELDTSEAKILVNEEGEPVGIEARERGISERLIEQFMLCANEAVASFLQKRGLPCVYRIHEDPSPEKLDTFRQFAYHLQLDIKPLIREPVTSLAMQTVMNEAKPKGVSGPVSVVLLRSLAKARYSASSSPHFGLAIPLYCHFTSPIRRYPDLMVHRLVKLFLHDQYDEHTRVRMKAAVERAAKQSSETELQAMNAERAIEDMYKVIYMQDRVGQIFAGTVSSVVSFGFFVMLENTCEGLVPISSLNGYFTFHEKNLTLSCGKRVYHLGDRVRVRLTRADIVTRKLDMEIVEETETPENGE